MLFLDLETYSATPIKNGAHKYAEHAEIVLCGWAINDGPANVWDCTTGEPMPARLKQALKDCVAGKEKICMHNGINFDRVVIKACWGIDIPVASIVDTMLIAYQAALPGALGDLCKLYGFGEDKAKMADGKYLVQLFASPRPKHCKVERATRETHPAEWERYIQYCMQDIVAMREVLRRLPSLNFTAQEMRYCEVSTAIADRGMCIDLELVRGAVNAVRRNNYDLSKQTRTLTKGAVESVTRRETLLRYINEAYGLNITSLARADVERYLSDDTLPSAVRELLSLRLEGSKSSVAKYTVLSNATNKDGRLRGTLQFRGATRTGRFAGRLFQPQNLPRPSCHDVDEINAMIEAVKNGTAFYFYNDLNTVFNDCLRGTIIAPKGKKLVVADYSNIEGRLLAWMANETWKIQAFRDADNGVGRDLYCLTYGNTFGVDPASVNTDQRQVGKVLELAMGYGGGVGAFVTFARGLHVHLNDLASNVENTIDPLLYAEASEYYGRSEQMANDLEISKRIFVACDAVKRAWRKANPNIVKAWRDVEQACTTVLQVGGEVPTLNGRVTVFKHKDWLCIRLPSNRVLMYAQPRLPGEEQDCTFSYMGMNQTSRKWMRQRTYPGKLIENIVQAVACDLLCHALVTLEEGGYPPVTSIHDEVLCEVPNTDEYTVDKMKALMVSAPDWAKGLPLNAAGFESNRYRKD